MAAWVYGAVVKLAPATRINKAVSAWPAHP
jgi:hypothetical protein